MVWVLEIGWSLICIFSCPSANHRPLFQFFPFLSLWYFWVWSTYISTLAAIPCLPPIFSNGKLVQGFIPYSLLMSIFWVYLKISHSWYFCSYYPACLGGFFFKLLYYLGLLCVFSVYMFNLLLFVVGWDNINLVLQTIPRKSTFN